MVIEKPLCGGSHLVTRRVCRPVPIHLRHSIYHQEYVEKSARRNVQRALNRGENYHKLRRAVSHANFGKLRFKTEQEQHLWNECSRLITKIPRLLY